MVIIDASDGVFFTVDAGSFAGSGTPPPILKRKVSRAGHFARCQLQEAAIVSLRSLIVAVLVVLAGCATPPRAPVEVTPVTIPASTWQQVDREIVTASQAATEQSRIYARGAMDYWRTRVYELTEQNFIPWFSSCLLYTSPSPRDGLLSRMPSSA